MSCKVDFLDDMRNLVYDPKRNPQDDNIFILKDWSLSLFQEKEIPILENVPSANFLRKKSQDGIASPRREIL